MAVKIQLRRDLAANWGGSTVLASGEVGYETDTGNIKIGDGTTQWSALVYYQLPNVSVNPATMANLNDSAYRVMGRYRLNSVTGGSTFTNAPSDLDTADADSYCAMIVTSHAYTALSTLIQQTLTQFSGNGTTLKQWVRMYDGTNWTAWTSTAHLSDGEVTTAKIADDAVTAAKLADSASTDANRAVTTNHIRDSAVTTAKISEAAVTFAKMQNSATAGLSVVGRSTNSAGDFAEINAANDAEVLRRNGSTVGFGQIATAGIADSAVTTGKLANSAVTAGKLSAIPSLTGVTYFTGSGTFTVPTGVTGLLVTAVGGGGGGGSQNPGGTGGSGGCLTVLFSVTPGTGIPYSVGAGGAGAASGSSNSAGAAGGSTTFIGMTAGGGSGASSANNGSNGTTSLSAAAGGTILAEFRNGLQRPAVTVRSRGGGSTAVASSLGNALDPGSGAQGSAANGGTGASSASGGVNGMLSIIYVNM